MALRRPAILAAAAITMAGTAHAADRAEYNRSLNSVHQPIVSRTDYSLDIATGADGLAPGEVRRLDDWFDQLALGYGDTVTVAGGAIARDGVGRVLSRYGMLVSQAPAPVNAGQASFGQVRVIVSRAVARVEGCPDWRRGGLAEFEGASQSNYGCAAAQNLAAMVANPQDLVEGAQAHGAMDPALSVKAVAAWRDAASTGKNGLKSESTKGGN